MAGSPGVLFHHALLFEGLCPKVEQDGEAQAGSGQVVVGLGFVGFGQGRDGFELQDDLAVHHEISDVFADQATFVCNRQAFLGLERNAAQG